MEDERWSIHEVSAFLGVTRQRVEAVARQGGAHFPAPAPDQPVGPRQWNRPEIEAWAEARWWGRYPWRTRPEPPRDPDAHRPQVRVSG